jgi:hypothetical protein
MRIVLIDVFFFMAVVYRITLDRMAVRAGTAPSSPLARPPRSFR